MGWGSGSWLARGSCAMPYGCTDGRPANGARINANRTHRVEKNMVGRVYACIVLSTVRDTQTQRLAGEKGGNFMRTLPQNRDGSTAHSDAVFACNASLASGVVDKLASLVWTY